MKKLILILLLLLATSCVTERVVTVPVETVRTEYVNKIEHDSIYVRDSIYVESRHDTVFQYKYKYIYKNVERVDTFIKNDTVSVIVPVTTEVVKEVNVLKFWQKLLMFFGSFSLLIYITNNLGSIKKWIVRLLKFFGI